MSELNTCAAFGFKMNVHTTKYMTNLAPNQQITIQQQEVELVDKSIYLGHEIESTETTRHLNCKEELLWSGQHMVG